MKALISSRFVSCMFIALIASINVLAQDATPLFDGKSLEGWETIESDQRLWKVTDGAIVGGDASLKEMIPHNSFLSSKESFGNFELRLKVRLRGTEGFVNSGVQILSTRVTNSSEMSGYQIDAGDGWWGKLYDESRRNKVIAEPTDGEAVARAVKKDDWNEYRIVAENGHIRAWINDVPTFDYTESDKEISQTGHIGLQVHGSGKTVVEFKDITVKRL
jgi:hypothetical protein